MSNLDSFSMFEQCEEVYDNFFSDLTTDDMEELDDGFTNDVLDKCEVISLDQVKDSYEMESALAEELDYIELADINMKYEQFIRSSQRQAWLS